MRCAVYARISRDPEEQSAGVDRQLVRGKETALSRGWTVSATFVDNDASGYRGERPGFDELQDAIRAGEIEVVLVQHQDRLARNVTAFRRFADLCVEHDVRIETWAGPLDTASASGRFTSTIQAATDEHYSALISEKARAAHAEIAGRGEPNGGRRPFGYVRTRNAEGFRTFEPHPDEAPELVRLFDRAATGASLHSLAVDLNDRGVATAGGSQWRTARIRDVLSNITYIGMRTHRGEALPGNWEPLVDRETFETVQLILSGRVRGPFNNVRKRFLAGGIARCGLCDRPLVSKPIRGKSSYVCHSVTDGGCGKIRVDGEGLEDHVSDLILEALANPRIGEALERRQGADNSEIVAKLDALDRRRTELAEAFAMNEIDRAQLRAGTARIDEQRQDLRSQLAPTRGPLLTVGDLVDLWESEDVEWRHRVAAVLFDKVIVNPAVRGRNYFDPGRVDIVWNT